MDKVDRFKGCLVGGASGDALGYEVEFNNYDSIKRRFGKKGITSYVLHNGYALISDDTQMSLFTANGLMNADINNLDYIKSIYKAYLDWYYTQKNNNKYYRSSCWLYNIDELHSLRAPGLTCTGSLRSGKMGTLEKRINNSNGCGGVMRVAPIGLFFSPHYFKEEEIFLMGASVAAVTHGGDLAIIPSACLTSIINNIVYNNCDIEIATMKSLEIASKYFDGEDLKYFITLIKSAISMSKMNINDYEAITGLGEGWTGEEALAIAIYSSLKYKDNIKDALICAVNHNGDSDSTGSITGQILGAYLGINSIPKEFINNLEINDIIIEIATDLYYISNKENSKEVIKKYKKSL